MASLYTDYVCWVQVNVKQNTVLANCEAQGENWHIIAIHEVLLKQYELTKSQKRLSYSTYSTMLAEAKGITLIMTYVHHSKCCIAKEFNVGPCELCWCQLYLLELHGGLPNWSSQLLKRSNESQKVLE